MNSNPQIGRGWPVFSADRKRVGDVTEVHGHYILVSRGVFFVKDMYLPLGTVDKVDNATVVLTVTYDVLRKMNLSHEPPVPAEPAEPQTDYGNSSPRSMAQESLSDYPSEATSRLRASGLSRRLERGGPMSTRRRRRTTGRCPTDWWRSSTR